MQIENKVLYDFGIHQTKFKSSIDNSVNNHIRPKYDCAF